MRQPPLTDKAQRLRWVDGEALCVVRDFWRHCRGQLPAWLTTAAREPVTGLQEEALAFRGRRLILRQSPPVGVLRRWLARLRGRRVTSPGLRQSGRVFRLERFGVPGPRLLAFGQRPDGAGFVLLQPPAGTMPLTDWLATSHPSRLDLLYAAGALIRQLHDAGYRLTDPAILHVRRPQSMPSPILADVQPLRECRHADGQRDLPGILRVLALPPDDAAALVGGYRGDVRLATNAPATQPLVATPGGADRHA
jgi:hypothetical protein